MDLNNLGLFKLMQSKLQWLTQRQEVLSENVANVDTPQYQARDLKPFTFQDAIGGQAHLAPALTDPAHLASVPRGGTGPGKAQRDRAPYETKPDGNAVVLEEQMMKESQVQLDYQSVTSLYKKQVGMIKMALQSH